MLLFARHASYTFKKPPVEDPRGAVSEMRMCAVPMKLAARQGDEGTGQARDRPETVLPEMVLP